MELQTWITGSHMYGLETEDSDLDRSGVYFSVEDLVNPFYNAEFVVRDGEYIRYSLFKFARLLYKGNPTILDLVFSPPEKTSTLIQSFIAHVKPYAIHEGVLSSYYGYMKDQYRRGFSDTRNQGEKRRVDVGESGYDTKQVSHAYRLSVTYDNIVKTGRYFSFKGTHECVVAKNIKLGKYTKEEALTYFSELKEYDPEKFMSREAFRDHMLEWFNGEFCEKINLGKGR